MTAESAQCPTVTRADVAAAAPPWVRDLLARVTGAATVVHSGTDAVYLRLGDEVVAVLSRHAVRVPCGLRTTLTCTGQLAADRRPPMAGTRVAIDDRRVRFTGADVHVGRTVSHAAPTVDPVRASDMAARLAGALGPTVGRVRGELPRDQVQSLADADPRAVEGLLGRGSGLTPLGDDVLCGWLATVTAAAHPCASRISTRVLALANQRTTALSATLLRRAACAEVIPQFTHLVDALTHRPEALGHALHDLTDIGHSSGSGLALGLFLALDHLGSRSTCS